MTHTSLHYHGVLHETKSHKSYGELNTTSIQVQSQPQLNLNHKSVSNSTKLQPQPQLNLNLIIKPSFKSTSTQLQTQ